VCGSANTLDKASWIDAIFFLGVVTVKLAEIEALARVERGQLNPVPNRPASSAQAKGGMELEVGKYFAPDLGGETLAAGGHAFPFPLDLRGSFRHEKFEKREREKLMSRWLAN